jgi:aminomethyltransferase
MAIGTPFHERTFALCESLNYREWSGYYTVSAYETHHDHEYSAIRNATALIDISPLFKYRVTGKDATRLVDRIITRDMQKVAVGQVIYTPWCDEYGKVIDDGTVSRLEENFIGGRQRTQVSAGSRRTQPALMLKLKTFLNQSPRSPCKGPLRDDF